MRSASSRILKITVSVVVSLLAGYLALRNVDFQKVIAGIHRANLTLIVLVLLLHATTQVVRSLRWGMLLKPLEPLSQRLLLPITCIGFLFVWILPARLGEMARPYLLNQNSRVGLSAAMGSVVLERLVDAGFLVFLLAMCLPALRIPGWLHTWFQGFFWVLGSAALLLLLGSVPRFRNCCLQVVFKFFPEAMVSFLSRILETFYSGMQAAASIRRLLAVLALTAVMWGITAVANMVLFQAMDLQLGWLAAVTVLVLTCLGIALPAAPGFIGNYHYACVLALTLLGVVKETALAFAIVIHFILALVIVLMGVSFMSTIRLKMGFAVKRQHPGAKV
ncbi:MAG: lysylphosphatidylglycerol synthase transmembrane domain-containing protein [Syntrophobacteria bacterium]